jgi:hypothetical protein
MNWPLGKRGVAGEPRGNFHALSEFRDPLAAVRAGAVSRRE